MEIVMIQNEENFTLNILNFSHDHLTFERCQEKYLNKKKKVVFINPLERRMKKKLNIL